MFATSPKKIKTYNKSYFVEFRFKKGSVFCYLHTIIVYQIYN
nr:DUF226 domain-containing protein [Borreliella garinii]